MARKTQFEALTSLLTIAVEEEGLFRLSGHQPSVERIKVLYEKGKNLDTRLA